MVTTTEIPIGYNKTDLGIFPNDWELKFVEEIAEVRSGKRLPLGKFLTEKETSHPYIRIIDMFSGGVSLKDIKYVPDDVYPAIKNYRIFKNDIFISVAGTLGMVGKIPIELDGANLTENADRLTNIRCNRDYLLYVFMSFLIQNTIESERTLGAQPKLALTRIKKFLIPLPPTEGEQTAIASALNDTNELITKLEELITKKRSVKQGAMQELLTGKKRLPGFTEKWETKKLGEIVQINMGQSPDSKNYNSRGEGLPLVQGNADIENRESIKRVWTSQITKTCSGGEILMTVRAPVGAICIASEKSCIGRGVCSFRVIEADDKFLYHLLIFKEQDWKILEQGSTFTSANSNQIFDFQLTLPEDQSEQSTIAHILSDIDLEIEELEVKLDKYRMIKQGMMQELLTGKTRLI